MIDYLPIVVAHASTHYPDECCGYITDRRVVECTNAAADKASHFEFTSVQLFEFARAFDSADPPRILYHSHPNGRAYLSATDRRDASYPVQHLVVGISADGPSEAALFAADFSEIQRWVLR